MQGDVAMIQGGTIITSWIFLGNKISLMCSLKILLCSCSLFIVHVKTQAVNNLLGEGVTKVVITNTGIVLKVSFKLSR